MADLSPTVVEVEFYDDKGKAVTSAWMMRDKTVSCGHCGALLHYRNRQKHLDWHARVEQYPPSTEVFYYDTRQRFVIKEGR